MLELDYCTINMKMRVVHNANNKEQRLKYKTCNKYMLEYNSCTINIKMRVVHNYRTKNRAQKNKNYVDLPLRLGDYEGNTKTRVSGVSKRRDEALGRAEGGGWQVAGGERRVAEEEEAEITAERERTYEHTPLTHVNRT